MSRIDVSFMTVAGMFTPSLVRLSHNDDAAARRELWVGKIVPDILKAFINAVFLTYLKSSKLLIQILKSEPSNGRRLGM